MMKDVLRTVDTVTDDIVFCPACGSTQVEVIDRYGRYTQVECKLCDFAWTE